MKASTRRLARAVAGTRTAWGTVLLLDTGRLLRGFGEAASPGPVLIGRVLGGRQVAQGAITALAPTPAVLAVGAAADTLHALTAVALMVTDPRRRALGLTETLIAGTFAATGWWLAATAAPGRPRT